MPRLQSRRPERPDVTGGSAPSPTIRVRGISGRGGVGRQSSLFADAETEWSKFAEIVDSLWSLSEKLVPLTPAEARRVSKDGGRLFDERVVAGAHKLADDARISTFDRLGSSAA